MRLGLNIKESIAAVARISINLFASSSDISPALADSVGSVAEGIIKGFNLKPETTYSQLMKTIKNAIQTVVSSGEFELPDDCREQLKEEAFSIQNALGYLQSDDPVQYLKNIVRCVCEQSEDCDMKTLPLEAMVEEIIIKVDEAVYNNHELTGLAALMTAKQIKEDTGEIKGDLKELLGSSRHEPASLLLPGFTPVVELIGREDDLADFESNYMNGWKPCVISGIGGAGKTEFLKAYLKNSEHPGRRAGWFVYSDSFRSTLLNAEGLVKNSRAAADDAQNRYEEIMQLLKELSPDDVLAFDNVGHIDDAKEDFEAILSLPCMVVLTTRESFSPFDNILTIYQMSFLQADSCLELFERCRGKKKRKQ